MTQKKMMEIIMDQFPDRGETELRTMLNSANDQFVNETKIIRGWDTITSKAETVEYSFDDMDTHGGGTPLLIEKVKVDGDPVLRLPDHTDRAWTTEMDTLLIGNYDTENGNVALTSFDERFDIEIYGSFSDPGFGESLDSTPNYPRAFHEAPMARVLEKLYARSGVLELTRYWRNEYQEIRMKAKQRVGARGTKGNYQTEQVDFRGNL